MFYMLNAVPRKVPEVSFLGTWKVGGKINSEGEGRFRK